MPNAGTRVTSGRAPPRTSPGTQSPSQISQNRSAEAVAAQIQNAALATHVSLSVGDLMTISPKVTDSMREAISSRAPQRGGHVMQSQVNSRSPAQNVLGDEREEALLNTREAAQQNDQAETYSSIPYVHPIPIGARRASEPGVLRCAVVIHKHPCTVIIDTGCSHSTISEKAACKFGLLHSINEAAAADLSYQTASGEIAHPIGIIDDIAVQVGNLVLPLTFQVTDGHYDALLGMDWIVLAGASITSIPMALEYQLTPSTRERVPLSLSGDTKLHRMVGLADGRVYAPPRNISPPVSEPVRQVVPADTTHQDDRDTNSRTGHKRFSKAMVVERGVSKMLAISPGQDGGTLTQAQVVPASQTDPSGPNPTTSTCTSSTSGQSLHGPPPPYAPIRRPPPYLPPSMRPTFTYFRRLPRPPQSVFKGRTSSGRSGWPAPIIPPLPIALADVTDDSPTCDRLCESDSEAPQLCKRRRPGSDKMGEAPLEASQRPIQVHWVDNVRAPDPAHPLRRMYTSDAEAGSYDTDSDQDHTSSDTEHEHFDVPVHPDATCSRQNSPQRHPSALPPSDGRPPSDSRLSSHIHDNISDPDRPPRNRTPARR